MTERIGMARYASGAEPAVGPCRGFELLPWRDECAEDVCLLMCANSAPSDRNVYPVLATREGALLLIRSVMKDKHGKFLRELSLVAKADEKTVGFLISTLLLDGSVLVLDIAVDSEYRRRGIGSAMMRWLVSECAAKDKDQVVLAVTAQNLDAIRLYDHLGFKQNMAFRQYVLSRY
jgi:ribosomal protein S18 acetylase RimI-like enzyme